MRLSSHLRHSCLLTLVLALALLTPLPSRAQPDLQMPVQMEAGQMGYDQQRGIVVAMGEVEVVQGDYVLLADRITYYQEQNVVHAEGNVSMLEPDGNIYFAESVELTDDLKQGVINQFRARLSDNSVFAANEARKIDENTIELHQAVYSPCKICEGKSPFWQLKADKIIHDDAEQRIYYEDAYIEFFGIPLAYTPYFAHAAPDADRKSGFLTPEYATNSNLGTIIRTPYYLNIAPNSDATITPWFTTEEGIVIEGEYRVLTDKGDFEVDASFTAPEGRDADGLVNGGRDFRGHIFALGESDIDEHWKWGFDIQRSTDDTYLRRYRFGNEDTLTSRIYSEALYDRNYFIAQGLAFQGLEIDDDPDTTPYVLPLLSGHYETTPGWGGSRFHVDASSYALGRELGPQSRRLVVTPGWTLPFVTESGHLFEFTANLRTDIYSVEDVLVPTSTGTRVEDGTNTRVVPQAALSWRYPLMRQIGETNLVIEPTVMFTASSSGNNPFEIPNEDNLVTEFTDANLFRLNRFPGYDSVEDGSGVAYGLRGQLQFSEGDNMQFLFGQHYSTERDAIFPYTADPGEHFSDYVGRVGFHVSPVDISYRFRLDQDDFTPNRHELRAGYASKWVSFNLDYIALEDDPLLQELEELSSSVSFRLSEEWSMSAYGRRDLNDGQMIYAGTGLTYQNECFTLLLGLSRQYIRDRDVEPDTSFSVRVQLKNLN